jgi:pimeloyl-ACP methyl ester carboxylesterase
MSLDPLPWYERSNLDIQEFSAAGIRTFAVVEGRADAFPAIFLHGLPGGAFLWADLIKAIGRGRLCIAPDLPGWGRSHARFAPTAPDYSAQGLLKWLHGLLTAQGVDRFDLVAHGDACWPALELLSADPARVRRLALVSATLWPLDERRGALARLFGKARWTTKEITRWLEDRAALTPAARERYLPLFEQSLGDAEHPRTSPRLADTGFPARMIEYRRALAAYRGATLLLWGAQDPQSPPERTAELVAALSDPDVHRIANAGHFPMLDAPAELQTRLTEFLRD